MKTITGDQYSAAIKTVAQWLFQQSQKFVKEDADEGTITTVDQWIDEGIRRTEHNIRTAIIERKFE